MNLHQYYKENKDEINSSIMEIASDLAIARLVDKHKLPFDAYVEPEDPDDPDSGTCYKEEYQDEYNRFYDEEYNRLAQLMKFDITSPDGIARNGNESRVTEVKTVYATVRYDIENRNGGEVSEEDIASIVSAWTGVPVHRLVEEETARLLPRHENRGRLHCELRNMQPQ